MEFLFFESLVVLSDIVIALSLSLKLLLRREEQGHVYKENSRTGSLVTFHSPRDNGELEEVIREGDFVHCLDTGVAQDF